MPNLYDIAYTLTLALSAPLWLPRTTTRHKVLSALGQRMGHVHPRQTCTEAILIHAVSLGEINATRALVNQLQQHRPDLHIIITTTTATGYDRGRQLYGGRSNITLTRFPLDFSSAINRLLDAVKPNLIVLMEGEIWPNFLLQCHRRKIPVLLINGRISDSAYGRYRRIKFITVAMLRRINAICVQDQLYADRFKSLGAPIERLTVTGTMKFDTAQLADSVPGDQQLAADLGLNRDAGPLWVCGSTGPGEEFLLLGAYRTLLRQFPALRLAIIPRKPERFDEVAGQITAAGFPLLRRSSHATGNANAVILGDTMGELRKFYSLADAVFVGRSLVNLGSRQWGSDMIEPAALGKPVVVGPWTRNFAEAVRSFKASNAIIEITTIPQLIEALTGWLQSPDSAAELGKRARQVVQSNQGATARHVEVMLKFLPPVA
jgi:3-deoxy-D-manno-octulosonic-acid transferase